MSRMKIKNEDFIVQTIQPFITCNEQFKSQIKQDNEMVDELLKLTECADQSKLVIAVNTLKYDSVKYHQLVQYQVDHYKQAEKDHEKAEKWDLYLKLADIPEPTFENIKYLARSWKKWVASNAVTVLGGKQIDKYHKYAEIVNRLNERIKLHEQVKIEMKKTESLDEKSSMFKACQSDMLEELQKIRDGK